MEDLIIALSTSNGLKAVEIFEFMKVAASQQSDAPKALDGMAKQIDETINLRPSVWVQQDLGVLNTVDVTMKNDRFIMACARGDMAKYNECLAKGQELAAIHSELKYTALHAAADFGSLEIVDKLLLTGISPNVRDARYGRTALHFAAQSGRNEIAVLLLDRGADRTLTCFSDLMPFEVADDQGHFECREILKQVPPEVQIASVTHCTDSEISIEWSPPITYPHLHAKIDEFMVIHECTEPGMYSSGDKYTTKDTKFDFYGLRASTGHAFVIMSHSVSGWSKPSSKLIHFTLPSPPCQPPQVEMLKVTKNGLLIHWHHPQFENGGPVTVYQLEMTDEDKTSNEYEDTDSEDDRSEFSLASSTVGSQSISSSTIADNIPNPENMKDGNKWHRVIKHRDINVLTKYVMGLKSYHDYYFRVICKNEFGWSPWSKWVGPFTPQEGVVVRQFGQGWLKIGWVEPILSNGRTVSAYEVQMCQPLGALSSNVSVYQGSREERRAKSGAVNYDFTTVSDDYTQTEATIPDLLPGKKYQFRVRPCIEGVWNSWENCLLSDVLTVPSAAPDVPHHVKVMMQPEFKAENPDEKIPFCESSDSLDLEKMNIENAKEAPLSPKQSSESKTVRNLRNKVNSSNANANAEELLERNVNRFAITHNSIDIEWINGVPNGSTIQEVEVQAAKIREYHVDDIEKASKAAGTEVSWDQYLAQSYNGGDVDDLDWVNITTKDSFLSSQSFRASGLVSGASYVFRVRQRNDVHWSSFSKASKVITTLIAAPPTAPEVIMVSPGHVIAEWKIVSDASFVFSSLRSDLRIAYLDTEGNVEVGKEKVIENEANPLDWWEADQQPTGGKSEAYEVCDRVLVDTLRPMTTYVLKVRVLTVAGWTTWSDISKPFRTLALP